MTSQIITLMELERTFSKLSDPRKKETRAAQILEAAIMVSPSEEILVKLAASLIRTETATSPTIPEIH